MIKKRILFISPHLDDAVLSCGGFIGKLSDYDYPVTVMTIFTGSPKEDISELAKTLHEEWNLPEDAPSCRRNEDMCALEYLGVEYIHEKFLDCIYRKDASGGEFLFHYLDEIMEQEIDREKNLIDAVAARLSEYFHSNRWDLVFVPLSIGGHIDHRIVHSAVKNTMRDFEHLDFLFYEDLPYAADGFSISDLDNALSDYMCYASRSASRKYTAMKLYASQIKTDTRPKGIDIDAIIQYGEKMGERAADCIGERIWAAKDRS